MKDSGYSFSGEVPPRAGQDALAVLISGGLDSAILLGEALATHAAVHPLYMRSGLFWETVELAHLRRFLEAVHCPALGPLQVLECPIQALYGSHWSVSGRETPGADAPDEAVYLPGRNVLLLSQAMLWCHLHGVPALALGLLASNPFPDATPAFFAAFPSAVNQAVGGQVRVLLPFAGSSKTEVLQRGRGFPLHLTFSCIRPAGSRHCGRCNKCGERRRAFQEAGLLDATEYASARMEPSCIE